jgi:hypothetical protein
MQGCSTAGEADARLGEENCGGGGIRGWCGSFSISGGAALAGEKKSVEIWTRSMETKCTVSDGSVDLFPIGPVLCYTMCTLNLIHE